MPGRIPKIVVIGGTYVDMAVRCGQIPSPGQTVIGSALSYTTTGPGPNQAAEAALCGCQVHLISKVGGDTFAQMAKVSLAEFDVNTDYVYSAEAKNTGLVVTLVNAAGENASCIYTGANSALLPQDIDTAEQIISGADVCLIHGRFPQEAIVTALRCAKSLGAKVILNPTRPIEQHGRQNSDLPIEYFSADILISAVITMGKRGCMVVDRNGADHIPAFEVELVDQTARGDAFAGALAAYCAVKDDVREAVKFASAAGALACTKFGSIEALPTKAEIIELLQKEDSE